MLLDDGEEVFKQEDKDFFRHAEGNQIESVTVQEFPEHGKEYDIIKDYIGPSEDATTPDTTEDDLKESMPGVSMEDVYPSSDKEIETASEDISEEESYRDKPDHSKRIAKEKKLSEDVSVKDQRKESDERLLILQGTGVLDIEPQTREEIPSNNVTVVSPAHTKSDISEYTGNVIMRGQYHIEESPLHATLAVSDVEAVELHTDVKLKEDVRFKGEDKVAGKFTVNVSVTDATFDKDVPPPIIVNTEAYIEDIELHSLEVDLEKEEGRRLRGEAHSEDEVLFKDTQPGIQDVTVKKARDQIPDENKLDTEEIDGESSRKSPKEIVSEEIDIFKELEQGIEDVCLQKTNDRISDEDKLDEDLDKEPGRKVPKEQVSDEEDTVEVTKDQISEGEPDIVNQEMEPGKGLPEEKRIDEKDTSTEAKCVEDIPVEKVHYRISEDQDKDNLYKLKPIKLLKKTTTDEEDLIEETERESPKDIKTQAPIDFKGEGDLSQTAEHPKDIVDRRRPLNASDEGKLFKDAVVVEPLVETTLLGVNEDIRAGPGEILKESEAEPLDGTVQDICKDVSDDDHEIDKVKRILPDDIAVPGEPIDIREQEYPNQDVDRGEEYTEGDLLEGLSKGLSVDQRPIVTDKETRDIVPSKEDVAVKITGTAHGVRDDILAEHIEIISPAGVEISTEEPKLSGRLVMRGQYHVEEHPLDILLPISRADAAVGHVNVEEMKEDVKFKDETVVGTFTVDVPVSEVTFNKEVPPPIIVNIEGIEHHTLEDINTETEPGEALPKDKLSDEKDIFEDVEEGVPTDVIEDESGDEITKENEDMFRDAEGGVAEVTIEQRTPNEKH